MKTRKHIYTTLIAFCLMQGVLKAQDINFSQFYDVPMLRNAALAGIFTGDVRLTSAYRNQWQAVTVPYRTIALGVEIKNKLVSVQMTSSLLVYRLPMIWPEIPGSAVHRFSPDQLP